MSNFPNFIRLVYRMRKAQKLYFKTRTQSALKAAQQLEDSVDRELGTMGFEGKQIQQLRLDAAASHRTDEEQGNYNA